MTDWGVRHLDARLTRAVPELALAAIAALMIMLEIWVFSPGGWAVGRTVAGLAAAGSLAFGRQAPFRSFLVNGLSIFALIGLGVPSDYYQWTNLVALFAVAARTELLPSAISLVIGYAGVVTYFLRFPAEGPPALAGAVLAIWTAGWFAGRAQRSRLREASATLQNEVARADLAAQQSRADLETERSRIAQELHDVVGHAVNVMVVHAGAGQGLVAEGSKERGVFDTIAATGRSALADLDRMLDVLQGHAARTPLPGLADLEALCSSVRSTGLDVDLHLSEEVMSAPPSVGLSVYRIVQEALTNVIKHARATSVRVEVGLDDDPRNDGRSMVISVRDNGAGGRAVAGRGLGGIATRAAMHRGSVQYGPAPDRGFELSVRLPAGAAA